MRRSQNGAVPVAHQQILGIFQTVTTRLGAETLLALLQLLQQAKVAGNLGSHIVCCSRRFVKIRGWSGFVSLAVVTGKTIKVALESSNAGQINSGRLGGERRERNTAAF